VRVCLSLSLSSLSLHSLALSVQSSPLSGRCARAGRGTWTAPILPVALCLSSDLFMRAAGPRCTCGRAGSAGSGPPPPPARRPAPARQRAASGCGRSAPARRPASGPVGSCRHCRRSPGCGRSGARCGAGSPPPATPHAQLCESAGTAGRRRRRRRLEARRRCWRQRPRRRRLGRQRAGVTGCAEAVQAQLRRHGGEWCGASTASSLGVQAYRPSTCRGADATRSSDAAVRGGGGGVGGGRARAALLALSRSALLTPVSCPPRPFQVFI
jgi:hypothetical protein